MFKDDIDPKHFCHHSTKTECVSCHSQPGGGGTCYTNSTLVICWCNKEINVYEEENCSRYYQIVKPWTSNSYNSVVRGSDHESYVVVHALKWTYFLFLYTMLKIKHTNANMMPRLDKVLKTMVTGRKIEMCFCFLFPPLGTIPAMIESGIRIVYKLLQPGVN